jgi:hypothetical protein
MLCDNIVAAKFYWRMRTKEALENTSTTQINIIVEVKPELLFVMTLKRN